jgi:membrane protein, antimicrobial resistance system
MGQGIQQPSVQQSSGGNAWVDVVKVLFEPGAVFERVRNQPSFLAPYAAVMVVQIILFFVNLSYLKVALQNQMATQAPGRPLPGDALLVVFGLGILLIILTLILFISAFLLWVLVSLFGGEAKFVTLLSVALYGAVPSAILLAIVGAIVLHIQGPGQLTSPQDMQPALGLDLLAPGAKGFLGAVLKGINPFSLWGVALTGIGISTTHRLSKGTGYTVAIAGFAIALLIGGSLAAVFGGK